MKTLIAASALALFANVANAGPWWTDSWQNPDLDTRFGPSYGHVVEVVVPSNFRISLYEFNRGNPEYSYLKLQDYEPMFRSHEAITSLDRFNRGNPDVHTAYAGQGA